MTAPAGTAVRWPTLAIACVWVLSLGAADPAAAAPETVPDSVPSRVEVLPITSLAPVGPQAVVARVSSGYCAGDPYRPYIERVTLRWHRLSPSRFDAVLTARVRAPFYLPPRRTGEGPENVQVCAGLGLDLRAKVALPQPLAGVSFFDGSAAPPKPLEPVTYPIPD